eukprot:GHVN01059134.1.p1 GENE.GHVN01059134.1~~GHVN01059134.1.p1  ORF type:complete len:274 (+),score=40.51 GHVN01059134.1:560-1381(+)
MTDPSESSSAHVEDDAGTTEMTCMEGGEVAKMTSKELMSLMRGDSRRYKTEALAHGPHVFWDTQPVPKMGDAIDPEEHGPLDDNVDVNEVRQEPYPLPDNYAWVTCNIDSEAEMDEIYELLKQNYVEDEDMMFRFDYSKPFLKWAFSPPGAYPSWYIGVRDKKQKLVAFISGVPAQLLVRDHEIKVAEINFLCVHKKLRSRRLAPMMIREVTRRVNLTGIWQAVYTSGSVLPKPIAKCKYWHRSLNIKKLVDVSPITRLTRITKLLSPSTHSD